MATGRAASLPSTSIATAHTLWMFTATWTLMEAAGWYKASSLLTVFCKVGRFCMATLELHFKRIDVVLFFDFTKQCRSRGNCAMCVSYLKNTHFSVDISVRDLKEWVYR